MGLLRLLLATAVLVDHTADPTLLGLRLIDSTYAVELFFILSGFYMAMVLDRTYRGDGRWWQFMRNRVLRLYPIYWVVLLLTIPVQWHYGANFEAGVSSVGRPNVIASATFVYPELLTFEALVLLIGSQIAIVGQDLVWFVAVGPAGLLDIRGAETGNSVELFRYLFVPQAWTLAVEMLFYALAPFLARQRTWTLVWVLLGALLLRGWMYVATDLMAYYAWKDKFLPAELWTFVAGMLAYRAYVEYAPRLSGVRALRVAPVALVGLVLLFPLVPFARVWMLYPIALALVPAAFAVFDRAEVRTSALASRVDRVLGDLSYPLYISHVLVLQAAYEFVPGVRGVPPHPLLTPAILLASLAASGALLVLVANPVERLRGRIRDEATSMSRAERRRVARAAR